MNAIIKILAVLVIAASLGFSQLDRGSFTGVVTDPTGAAIPGVTITVRNTATGATYRTVSNESGQYSMPNLPRGAYELVFEAASFKKLIRDGVQLGATEVLRIDARLEVGALTESVQVTAEAPRLQTETPEVGTSLSNRELVNLPLGFSGARIAENFSYKVSPGVSGNSYTSHINGSTSFSKETLLDGASITVYRAGDFGQMSTSIEALAEFKVQSSGMSAEFGRTQGGVFNFVMKSGTNELHGSLHGGLRNEVLHANTFVNNARGVKRTPDRKINYAGSFGGPVYIPKIYNGRDRTFFYVAYEHYRERTLGYRAPDRTVPLPEFYEGDFSRLLGAATGQTDAMGRPVLRGSIYDPATFRQMPGSSRWIGDMFPGNRIPVSRFSQVARNINAIASTRYLPTVRDSTGAIPLVNNATFPTGNQPEFDQYQFSVKGDHIISAAHKLSGSYAYNSRPRILTDQGGMWDQNDPVGGPFSKARLQTLHSNLARFTHDWTVSPRTLNHFMIYVNRLANPNSSVHKNVDGAKELGIRNLSTVGYPVINWGGGPFVSLQTPGDPQDNTLGSTTWAVLNTMSFSKGRHFMKAGFDFRSSHLNSRTPSSGGAFNFNATSTAIPNESFAGNLTGYSFASYLLGIVNSASLNQPVGLGARRYYYAGFFQDDFKVNDRLTLQLGLRWEFQPPTTEVANRMANWSSDVIDPASRLPGAYEFAGNCTGCSGKTYFGRNDLRNWGPRIGFAWRPLDRWTVRGSYGIFYEADAYNGLSRVAPAGLGGAWGGTYQLNADATQPWRGIFNWDNGFPTDRYVPPVFNPSWGNSNNPTMVDPEYGRSPIIHQFNFNIQREIAKNTVLDIGYVGRTASALREGQLKRLNQIPASALEKYGRNLNNAINNAADAVRNGVPYPYPGFVGTVASALRPYPQVRANSTVDVYAAPLGFSTYHGLQMSVDRQFGGGLSVYANYVWSKSLTNMESSDPTGNTGRPLDYYNLSLEKAISDFDTPHMFKGYVNYELPFARRNMLLGGWSASLIVNYFSGTPLGFGGSFPLANGWNGATNRANIAAGNMRVVNFDKSKFELSTLTSPGNTYLNKSLYSDPAPLTLGTSAFRYAQARNFGTINEDVSLLKTHTFAEKYRFQLRAEFLNLFNRHLLGGINTSVTSPNFGQVTTVSGNRTVQIGARLDF